VRAVLCPPLSADRRLPAFPGSPNTKKLPSSRLPQAQVKSQGSAEPGGTPGSLKVIYGEGPACVRRVSGEGPGAA